MEQLSSRILLTVDTVGNVVTVDASDADNQIELTLGSEQHTLLIDGETHEIDATIVNRILIYADAGTDSVTIHGSDADDRVEAYDGSTEVLSANYVARVEGAESLTIDTGGGNDWVEIVDSEGHDAMTLSYDRASLTRGDGRTLEVSGHEETEAFATEGGTDTVNFTDSPGNDRFFAKYLRSFMLGDGFSNYARGFERVNADSSRGGEDEARMHDSPADDHLNVAGTTTTYQVEFATHVAKGFQTTKSYSTDGNDTATVFGNHFVTDVFVWEAESAFMYTTGIYDSTAPPLFAGEQTDSNVNVMIGFPHIDANGSDPSDRADLRGTPGDDTFAGIGTRALLQTASASIQANGFGITRAFGNGGEDQAYLEDTRDNNEYVSRQDFSYLEGPNFLNYVAQFEVDAVSKNGGFDNAEIWDHSGPAEDFLIQRGDDFVIYGPQRSDRVIGFSDAKATGNDAGLVVLESPTFPFELLGTHDSDDTPSEAVSSAYLERIDSALASYEVVDGVLGQLGGDVVDPVDPDPVDPDPVDPDPVDPDPVDPDPVDPDPVDPDPVDPDPVDPDPVDPDPVDPDPVDPDPVDPDPVDPDPVDPDPVDPDPVDPDPVDPDPVDPDPVDPDPVDPDPVDPDPVDPDPVDPDDPTGSRRPR